MSCTIVGCSRASLHQLQRPALKQAKNKKSFAVRNSNSAFGIFEMYRKRHFLQSQTLICSAKCISEQRFSTVVEGNKQGHVNSDKLILSAWQSKHVCAFARESASICHLQQTNTHTTYSWQYGAV